MKALKLTLLTLTCLLFTAASRPPNTPKDNLVATVNRIQDKFSEMALEYGILTHEARKLLVEMNTLMEDIDKVIRKIDSHEITYLNDEIENIGRRIDDFHDKSAEITSKVKSLNHRQTAIKCELDAKPRLKRLVNDSHLQESIGEWNSFVDDEYNPQMLIYNDRVHDFNSRVDKLPR